mgnify:CR=1 FL=1
MKNLPRSGNAMIEGAREVIEPCFYCNGKGTILREVNDVYITKLCPECNGTGKQEVEI